MRLLRLEMKGFKSFADKTIIHFSPELTAIVGPNGSGKSNITDAMRWVLGEANVRQLRGLKSEDIIFSGTSTRKAMAAAEVVLVLDNTDGQLKEELAEVAIGRRIYRNGDSEFFINKRLCRLKDIHALLADTGIGKDAMAIISQNRVDAILNSKPEERRLAFEDVAGIAGFKANKEDALRRMGITERNMERLHDLLFSLREQLTHLAERAEQTKAHSRMAREKRLFDGVLTYHRVKTAERILTRLENESISLQEKLIVCQDEMTRLEKERNRVQEDARQGQVEAQEIENAYSEVKQLAERSRGQISVLLEQEKNKQRESELLHNRLRELQKSIDKLQEQIDFLQVRIGEEEQALQEKNTEYGQAEDTYHGIVAMVEEKERNLSTWREQQEKSQCAYVEQMATKEGQKQSLSFWREEQGRLIEERAVAVRENQEAAEAYAACQTAHDKAQCLYKEREADLYVAKGRLEDAGKRLKSLRSEQDDRERRYNQKKNKVEFLGHWLETYSGFGEVTKRILTCKEPWRKHIIDAVGNLFTTSEPYRVAVEIALGNAVNHLVTADTKAAGEAMTYLRNQRGGRATFLPLTTVKGVLTDDRVLQEKNVLGRAVDFIQFEEAYTEVFNYLLGRVFVVKTLAEGISIQKKYHQRLRLVTLEGDQLQPGGPLVGGSVKKQQYSLLAQRAEFEKETRELAELTKSVQTGNTDLESALQFYERQENVVREHDQICQEARRTATICENKLVSMTEAWERAKSQHADITAKIEQATIKIQNLEGTLRAMQETLEQQGFVVADKENTRLEAELKEAQALKQKAYEELTNNRLNMEYLQKSLTEKRIALAEKKEQLLAYKEQIQPVQDALSLVNKEVLQTIPTAKEAEEATCNVLEERENTLALQREEIYGRYKDAQERMQSLADSFRLEQETLQTVQKKLLDLEGRLTRSRLDVEQALQELQQLGFTAAEAQRIPLAGSVKELIAQQEQLVLKMEELGPINPNAVQEYEDAVARCQFLEQQELDVVKAKAQLEGIIAELNKAMSQQFLQMLTAVRTHFQRIFAQLFNGGTAQLVLTDEKNVLLAGIELYIQPPGKKRQPLSLLSGGERSLTVLALLFAFSAYRTAPFCVLDEVDAALDEVNVARFSQYLANLSQEMQFVVISHRKKTMEVATLLQGVTMAEQGVSKLLTVSFDEMEDIK